MNTLSKNQPNTLVLLAVLAMALATPWSSRAASGVWTNVVSGGLWSATANWTNATVADGSANTADFNSINITTDPTVVHLDAAHTLGSLIFGDTVTSSAASWVLDNNSTPANILTLAGGTPTITVNVLGAGKTASISAVIAGTAGLVKNGAGTLSLSGANTFTGGLVVSAGELDTSAGASGPGAVTVGNSIGTATLGVTGGTLALGSSTFVIGSGINASYIGVVNQSGGTVSFTGGTAMLMGNGTNTVATYNLSGGTLSTGTYSANNRGVMLGVNTGCSGIFNLTGTGTLSLGLAELQVGRDDSAVTGCTVAYNQSGSTAATVGYLSIGGQSGSTTTTATFNITNGTFVATNFQHLVAAPSSSASIYLGGGAQVTLPAFPVPAGTVNLTLDFTNGYLTPLAASLNYLSGLSNVYLTTNGANFNVGVSNIVVGQVLQNAPSQLGTLKKTGVGTLTLSGANTYSGVTTVSAGKLMGVTGGSLASSAVAVTPASGVATLGVNYTGGNAQWTCSSLSFNAGGTGTAVEFAFNTTPSTTTAPLNVSGNLTFGVTPSITVDVAYVTAGTYPLIVVGGTAPSAVPTLNWGPSGRQGTLSGGLAWGGTGNKTLILTVTGSPVEPLNWNSTATGNWDVNDTTNTLWKNSAPTPAATYYQETGNQFQDDQVVFGDTYITANTTVTLNSTVTPANVIFNNSTYNYTNTGTGAIAGGTTVTKNGTASVTLSTPNTYVGGTVINQGTVNTGVAGGLGTAAVNIGSAGTLNLTAAGVSYAGPSAGISGSGIVNVTTGSGSTSTLLNGANSGFTGTLNVGANSTGGKVQLNGVLSSSATVNVLSNSTVYVSGANQPAALTLYGGTTGEALGQLRIEGNSVWSGPLTIAGPIISSADGHIGANSGAGYITGNIGQSGGAQSLIKIGGGAVVLSGANTFTGPAVVNQGTLTVLGNQTAATGGYLVSTNSANGCALNIGTTTQTVPTIAAVASGQVVQVGSTSAGTGYSTISVAGTNGFLTTVTNNGTLWCGRDSGFAVGANANWIQTGDMMIQEIGGYVANYTISAGGTFTYAGVDPIYAVVGGSANDAMTIAGTFITGQGFNFTNNGSGGYPSLTISAGGVLALSTNVAQLITSTGTGTAGQFVLSGNATINTAGYSTTNALGIGGSGSLLVAGGGSLTLSGISTYTGGTTVNGGTLVLANGGSPGCVRNNLTLNSNAVVLLTLTDALGYYGGQSVTNVNINGSTLTNAAGNEGYNASFVLNGGTMSSGGGQYVLAGQSISSVSNTVASYVNAPILMRGNVLTLSAAAGMVPGGVDLNISGNLNQFDSSDALIKNGAGNILYGGTGNYSGSTTINAGKLTLASTASLPNTTNIIIAAGATLDVSAIAGYTLGGSQGISGSGTVNGSVADSGGSQFNPGGSGTVGTLTITTNLTLAGGDTLNFDFSAGGSNDVINVGGTLTPNGTTTINLANAPVGGFLQTNYVLIQAASLGGSAGSFTLANVPTGGRQTYNIVYNTSSSPQQVLLQVSGYNANLVWQGGSGNSWDIQITQDWLNGGSADYFYSSDNVLFSNVPPANAAVTITPANIAPGSVTFNTTNNYVLTGGYITGSANFTKSGTGSVTLLTANDYNGGTTINNGTLQLGDGVSYDGSVAGSIVNNSALVISNSSVENYNNIISGSGKTVAGGSAALTLGGNISGSGQVVVTGSGGLTLSGSNSYVGGTFVTNGVLTAVNATALGVPATGVLATLGSGGTLAYQVAGAQTLTNQIVGAGSLEYSNATPGSLGNGVIGLKLTASNSFSGGLTINVGSVYAYNNNALGTGPVTLDNGNGYGSYGYNQLFVGNGLNISNAITVVNASDYFDGVLMVDPGSGNSGSGTDTNGATFSGPITIATGAVIAHGGLFCGPFGTNWLVVSGPVTNLNAGAGIGSRNGRTRFSGGGSYSSFGIGGGTTQIGANNGICTNAALQIAGGSFDLYGYSQIFTGLSNPGGGSVNNSSTNASILTLDLSSDSTYSSVIAGNISLVENGAANLYLSGTNTYTGPTIINGGALRLTGNGVLTNTTSIFVESIATLDVSGTTSGTLALNTNQTLKGDGAFTVLGNVVSRGTIELKGSKTGLVVTNDSVNGLSSITYGGTLKLDLSGSPLASTDSFVLFSASTYSGAFTNIVPATPGAGLTWNTNNLIVNGTLSVQGGGIATNPTNITATVSGSSLVLSWPADHLGWILQAQTNSLTSGLGTNWVDVSSSASVSAVTNTIVPANPSVFYRLRLP